MNWTRLKIKRIEWLFADTCPQDVQFVVTNAGNECNIENVSIFVVFLKKLYKLTRVSIFLSAQSLPYCFYSEINAILWHANNKDADQPALRIAQSDQRLCYSLSGKNCNSTCIARDFDIPASLCS